MALPPPPQIKIIKITQIRIETFGGGGTGLGGGKDGEGLGGGKDGEGLGGGKDGEGLGGGEDGVGLGGGGDGVGLTFNDLKLGDGLEFGDGLKFGDGLEFKTGLEFDGEGGSGLKNDGLEFDGEDGGGLVTGSLTDKSGKGGKTKFRRPPEFVAIICGQPLTGERTVEIEWLYDNWGKLTHKVWTYKQEVNGKDTAYKDFVGYIRADGTVGEPPPTPVGNFLLGAPTLQTPSKGAWKLTLDAHSQDCEIIHNQPNPHGLILSQEVITQSIVNGQTSDQFLKAAPGQAIFPEWGKAWLSP